MSTVSFQFIVFFAIVLILYYVLPKKLQWGVLLVASGYFVIVSQNVSLTAVFLLYLLVNWIGSMAVYRLDGKKKYKPKKVIYIATVLFNIVLLITYRDLNFFINTANTLSGFLRNSLNLQVVSIAAPLGISYFSLILTSYMTDVYWGKFKPQGNFLKFCLFGGYFPQMSSGPFTRYDDVCETLYAPKKFDYDRILKGCIRMAWGFFKKLVVAERLAVMVNTVYGDYVTYAGWYVVFAVFCFVFQLYADFSGAMDIALGASECFGVILPENFDTPFYSTSIAEFWRRWHITLGNWLRDYVFYSIQRSNAFRKLKKWCKAHWGKNYEKRFNLPMYLGMFVTWFLIGFWHGGGWNYIWGSGIYYWILITASELCSPLFAKLTKLLRINTNCFSWKLFQRIRTFLLFAFGLSFFRASNLQEGFSMWKAALSELENYWIFFDESLYSLGLDRKDFLVAVWGLLVMLVVSMMKQRFDVRNKLMEQNYVFRLICVLALVYAVMIFGMYGPDYDAASFIYQGF